MKQFKQIGSAPSHATIWLDLVTIGHKQLWPLSSEGVSDKYLFLSDPIWFCVFVCLHCRDPRSVSERWHVCP